MMNDGLEGITCGFELYWSDRLREYRADPLFDGEQPTLLVEWVPGQRDKAELIVAGAQLTRETVIPRPAELPAAKDF